MKKYVNTINLYPITLNRSSISKTLDLDKVYRVSRYYSELADISYYYVHEACYRDGLLRMKFDTIPETEFDESCFKYGLINISKNHWVSKNYTENADIRVSVQTWNESFYSVKVKFDDIVTMNFTSAGKPNDYDYLVVKLFKSLPEAETLAKSILDKLN